MILVADYLYFVEHFGVQDITDHAFWAVGVSVSCFRVVRLLIDAIDIYCLDGE